VRQPWIGKALRRCRRRQRRARPAPAGATPARAREERVSEQGNRIDVYLLRGFLKRALEDDAVADAVNELLFKHVVADRYHPSVIAESLPSLHRGDARRRDARGLAGRGG
jgi:hypothetical protein